MPPPARDLPARKSPVHQQQSYIEFQAMGFTLSPMLIMRKQTVSQWPMFFRHTIGFSIVCNSWALQGPRPVLAFQ